LAQSASNKSLDMQSEHTTMSLKTQNIQELLQKSTYLYR